MALLLCREASKQEFLTHQAGHNLTGIGLFGRHTRRATSHHRGIPKTVLVIIPSKSKSYKAWEAKTNRDTG